VSTPPTCHEIADGIYRFSTHLPGLMTPQGLTVNQFLVVADEPLLFHTGFRSMSSSVSSAVARIIPLDQLRWISFGHVEADECGGLDQLLAAAPGADVALPTRCYEFAARDLTDRPAYAVAPRRALDLGGRLLRFVPTPHVPHNWESHVVFEEATTTLFCGDLLLQSGPAPATDDSAVARALDARDIGGVADAAAMAATLRKLADLEPQTIAAMHGSAFVGDGAGALREASVGWGGAS
jgi:flavorubredoxin